MSFLDQFNQYNWEEIEQCIAAQTTTDVERALNASKLSPTDFMALVSPAAEPYLEQMAATSRRLTLQRFGKTIRFYTPLYLSNVCSNECVYCGFSRKNAIKRVVLNDTQIEAELKAIKAMGFDNLLLVTGESDKMAGVDYLEKAIRMAKKYFAIVSVEVQPLEVDDYKRLTEAGLYGVYVYQETFNRSRYPAYHLFGQKSNFDYRLLTPDRLGQAKVHKIGLGFLMGLENWRAEAFFMALHLRYLQQHYWTTQYSISFPRIRPHEGVFQPNVTVSDRQLAQTIWAFRLFDPDVELALSTREEPKFRDHMALLGITSMSAGSKTEPGGYSCDNSELEQFAVSDSRSAAEVEAAVKLLGYEVIWKDWDKSF